MMKCRLVLVGLLGALALVGCKSNDDLLDAKGRELGERDSEIAALRKRLANEESIRLVMKKDLDATQQSLDAANAEADRLRSSNSQLEADLDARVAPKREPNGGVRKLGEGIDMFERDGAIVVRLDNSVTFSAGSASLSKNGQGLLLNQVAEVLASYPDHRVSVEGHTDDQPIKKSRWKTNLNLSIARALEVRRFLAAKAKITEDRMRIAAYGEHVPRIKANSKAARSKNRRVEIVLYRSASDN
jgi:chemotaxis protein MotB